MKRSSLILIIIGLVIVMLVAYVALKPGGEVQYKKITIGYQPSTHQTAAMVAAEKGWWKDDLNKFGIEEVEFLKFPSGPPEMQAMKAGELDIAYVGVAPPIANMYEGLNAKIIAGVQTQGSGLVLRHELADEYEGPISLKGLTIATYPPGSVQHIILSKWLSDHGVDPKKDVHMLPVKPGEAASEIATGAVDGVFLPSPHPTIIEEAGSGKIVEWSGSMWPDHACCCLVARGELIRKHPEMVEQIVRTHIRATEYEKDHPDEASEICARWIGVDASTVKRSIDKTDMRWIHDPHIEIDSGLEYARIIYGLNRERYEGRGIKMLREDDIFDTSFYDEIMAKR